MKQGFVKVAAASCVVAVADVRENTRVILETIHKMEDEGAKVMVLPELALTGYTCSDLFWQSQMIDAAKEGLKEIADGTKGTDALIFVGLPWEQGGKLFNVAAVLCHGELLGVVPKKYLPNYNEFYELRHFTPGKEAVTTTEFFGKEVPFGMNLLFRCAEMPRLKVAAELCEDLWTPNPPSVAHALAGATVIVNLSASDEMVGKRQLSEKPRECTVGTSDLRLYLCDSRRGRVHDGSRLWRTASDCGERNDSCRGKTVRESDRLRGSRC